MKTFYDILKVKQNATQEEILNSYYKLEKNGYSGLKLQEQFFFCRKEWRRSHADRFRI